MKKTKLKDKVFLPIIILFMLIGLITAIVGCIEYKDNRELLKEDFIHTIERCKNLKEETIEGEIEWCQKVIANDLSEFDTNASDVYELFILDEGLRLVLHEFIVIAVVVLGSAYYITKYLRNRVILNDITRENYKAIIKKLFLSSWKYALLIPTMLLTIFITITLLVEHFQVSQDILVFSSYEGIFQNNLLLYYVSLLVQSFVLSIIYININLIVSRKEHNYILSIIKTYLLIVGIQIFFEAVITNLFYKFNSGFGHLFNILNLYTNPFTRYNFGYIFVLLGILAVSFIPLFLSYKNKEKLIIDCEKNDNKEEV